MNLFTALMLSSKKQASDSVKMAENLFSLLNRMLYQLKVTCLGDNAYLFEIFHVTYPDGGQGKGWGDPHIAEQAHFSKKFESRDALKSFLEEEHNFSLDSWRPVEELPKTSHHDE